MTMTRTKIWLSLQLTVTPTRIGNAHWPDWFKIASYGPVIYVLTDLPTVLDLITEYIIILLFESHMHSYMSHVPTYVRMSLGIARYILIPKYHSRMI